MEAANERRKKDSEGLKLSADAYSSQTKKSSSSQKSSLRGISYSPSDADSSPSGPNRRLLSTMSFEIADAEETPSAPKFDFEEPPTVPQPPKVSKPNAPSDPTSDPNAFSSVPIPSAVAPAQPEQQIEGTSKESDNSFGGLFDLEKTSTKLQAVPEAPVQKAKVSDTTLCHFFG